MVRKLSMRRTLTAALLLTLTAVTGLDAERRASLSGSTDSMEQQHLVAVQHGLSFLRTETDVLLASARGELVELLGNEDYEVADVSQPFLHPAAKLFVERTAAGYRAACAQKLVVTSAVRPATKQPRNAHTLSVHPAGIAVDLRISDSARCRSWLEAELLELEELGVVNAVRERTPPHYHVAVFPEPYFLHVEEQLIAQSAFEPELEIELAARSAPASVAAVPLPGERGAGQRVALLSALLGLPLGLWVSGRRYRARRSVRSIPR